MFLAPDTDLSQALEGSYNSWMVLLSLLIAWVAVHASWSLSDRVRESSKRERFLWIGGGAVAMGFGIWSMHFVGMLAFHVPVAVAYDAGITAISVLPAIIASAVAIYNNALKHTNLTGIWLSGVIIGAGIGGMHYIGMAAMRMDASMAYDPWLFALSIVVAVLLSVIALYCKSWSDKNGRKHLRRMLSAAVGGMAIAGMHYTAMAAVYFFPIPHTDTINPALAPQSMGILITVAVTLVLLLTMMSTRFGERLAYAQASLDAQASANQLKDDFLSTVTHELLTPIHSMRLSLALARETADQRTGELLHQAEQSNRHLQNLVEAMITFSEARQGNLKPFHSEFAIRQSLEEQIAYFQKKKPQLQFKLDCDDSVPERICTDKEKLKLVINQLLKNAAEFTEKGDVGLHCRLDSPTYGPQLLWIEIEDSGKGIEADKLSGIFEAFQQADNSITRQHGGLGIGLTLVHELLNILDAKLDIDSSPGEGTRVRVKLPLSDDAVCAIDVPPANPARPPKTGTEAPLILIVEDNPVTLKLLEKALQRAQYRTLLAGDGLQALEQLESNQEVDAILMDCQMPVLDGIEATSEIRKLPQYQHLPIIAVTANVSQADRERCTEAGMNDFLPKPVNLDRLMEKLSDWLHSGAKSQ